MDVIETLITTIKHEGDISLVFVVPWAQFDDFSDSPQPLLKKDAHCQSGAYVQLTEAQSPLVKRIRQYVLTVW